MGQTQPARRAVRTGDAERGDGLPRGRILPAENPRRQAANPRTGSSTAAFGEATPGLHSSDQSLTNVDAVTRPFPPGNVTPGRRWNVHVRAPALDDQLRAIDGTTLTANTFLNNVVENGESVQQDIFRVGGEIMAGPYHSPPRFPYAIPISTSRCSENGL